VRYSQIGVMRLLGGVRGRIREGCGGMAVGLIASETAGV